MDEPDMKLYGQAFVSHLEAEIAWLKQQLAMEQAKVSRMEMAIMPLSSAAGKAYTEAVNPQIRATGKIQDFPKSWRQIQAEAFEEIANEHAIRQEKESSEGSAADTAKGN